MAKAPKSQKPSLESHATNGWDVCIRFLDVINDLFKTGNIFGAVLLLCFVYVGFVTNKLSPENVNGYVLMFSKFLGSEKFYLFPIVTVMFVSIFANYFQHKYYTTEIKRLVSLRSQLIHGKSNGEIEMLPEHSSSEFNIEATE